MVFLFFFTVHSVVNLLHLAKAMMYPASSVSHPKKDKLIRIILSNIYSCWEAFSWLIFFPQNYMYSCSFVLFWNNFFLSLRVQFLKKKKSAVLSCAMICFMHFLVSVCRNDVKFKTVNSFPLPRCMLGGTMTMASRAMAQPQLTESPHWCKAWKARRSLAWLVGHHIA